MDGERARALEKLIMEPNGQMPLFRGPHSADEIIRSAEAARFRADQSEHDEFIPLDGAEEEVVIRFA